MPLSSEKGISVVELLVAISAGIAVLMGSFAMLNGTLRGSARTQQRVDANQRGRPVMTRIMDELHSVCVAPGVAPIYRRQHRHLDHLPAQDGQRRGPDPDRRTISLSSRHSERVGQRLSVRAPPRTTPSAARDHHQAADQRRPRLDQRRDGAAVSLLRLRRSRDQRDPADDAAERNRRREDRPGDRHLLGLAARRPRWSTRTPQSALTDSALFRFSPGAEDVGVSNLPCA